MEGLIIFIAVFVVCAGWFYLSYRTDKKIKSSGGGTIHAPKDRVNDEEVDDSRLSD